MNRRSALAILSALTLSLAALPLVSQSWETAVTKDLEKLVDSYYKPSVQAAFGTFTYAYTELASPFSRYLEEGIAAAIAKSSRIKLFHRAAAAAMDPAFREIYGEFFKTNGVDALLAGRFYEEGENVRARLELTGLSDGLLIGTLDLRVPTKSLPRGLAVDPSAAATATASSLAGILPQTRPGAAAPAQQAATIPLSVSVSTERGPGAAYREGEEMVVLVTVNKPAYAKIYHIDVSGKASLIWPNQFGGKGSLAPGAIMSIPGPRDPFKFLLTPPFGTEFIKVIASTTPFAPEQGGSPAEGGARGVISRGSVPAEAPSAGSGELAEALASYLIMERAK